MLVGGDAPMCIACDVYKVFLFVHDLASHLTGTCGAVGESERAALVSALDPLMQQYLSRTLARANGACCPPSHKCLFHQSAKCSPQILSPAHVCLAACTTLLILDAPMVYGPLRTPFVSRH
jgi:hypothetical protein